MQCHPTHGTPSQIALTLNLLIFTSQTFRAQNLRSTGHWTSGLLQLCMLEVTSMIYLGVLWTRYTKPSTLLGQVQYHGKLFNFIILAPSSLECLWNGHFNLMSFASVICTSSCRTSLLHLTFMVISIMFLTCSLMEERTMYGQTWCRVLGSGKKQ